MLKGTIHIGRVHSTGENDFITIEVTDDLSHTQALEINMSILDFAETVMGGSYQPCEFELRSSVVGKKCETKTVIVPLKRMANEKDAAKAFKPFEKDGWRGNIKDALNHHRWTKTEDGREAVSVGFTRWVPAEQ